MTLTVVEAPIVLAIAVQRLLADNGAGGVATLAGGRIYRDLADEGSAFPLVTVSWMSSEALQTANAVHVWSDVLVLVKIADRNSSRSRVEALESRIVSMLDGYGGVTLRGVYVTLFRLERGVSQPDEFHEGQRYTFSNLIFRTEAQPA